MMLKTILAACAAIAISGQAMAADLGTGQQCLLAGPAQLLSIATDAELTGEVVVLMNEAVNVADSDQWIDSRAPAFTWASEAKVACGKAYGYLQSGYRDDDTINKCECFHNRMRQSMN